MARPRQISDEQIMATMRACALQQGVKVSLDVVAEKLGVTSPALLKRFGSREALVLRALQPPEPSSWMAEFQQGPDQRPFEQQLAEHLERLWAYFSGVIPCVAALRESGVPREKIFEGRHSAPIQGIRVITRWLEQAKEARLIETDAPESVATALLGAVQSRAFMAHVSQVKHSSQSDQKYLKDVVTLFARALISSAPQVALAKRTHNKKP